MNIRPEILLALVFLLLNSWQDLKKKEIFLVPTLAFLAAGILLSLLKVFHGAGLFASFLCGAGGTFFSILSGERIGLGDVLILMTLCLFLNAEEMLIVLSSGSLFCMTAGVFLLIRTSGREKQIPFIPFLLAGMVLLIFMERNKVL